MRTAEACTTKSPASSTAPPSNRSFVNSLKVSEARITHEVFNQPPPLTGSNLYLADTTLMEVVRREEAGWADGRLRELGRRLGTEEVQRWVFEANENE